MVVGVELAGLGFCFAFACCCVAYGLCCSCLALCLGAVTVATDPFKCFESVVCVVCGVVEFCACVGAAYAVGVVFADAVGSRHCLAPQLLPVGWELGATVAAAPCHHAPLFPTLSLLPTERCPVAWLACLLAGEWLEGFEASVPVIS